METARKLTALKKAGITLKDLAILE